MTFKVYAREFLDSRGNPTIAAYAASNSAIVRAIVPSGASTGSKEALELRDKGKGYAGKHVKTAVDNVNHKIAPKINEQLALNQDALDLSLMELDGTHDKSNLGANAMLAVSLACAKYAATKQGKWLYSYFAEIAGTKPHWVIPFTNVINGGMHSGNGLSIQEFMLTPVRAKTQEEAIFTVAEIYQELKNVIAKKYGKEQTSVGDEGGFAPKIKNTRAALDLIETAIEKTGFEKTTKIAMDCAASSFYNEKKKSYLIDGKTKTSAKLLEYYEDILGDYPIVSIEDPFEENDFHSFSKLTTLFGVKLQIVTDDLTVSQPMRVAKAIGHKSGNALLLKLNQAGTVSEGIDAAKLSFKSNWGVMASHRSGDSEDTWLADLAVGLGCKQIKTGAPCRSERTSKYNRLLEIAHHLE